MRTQITILFACCAFLCHTTAQPVAHSFASDSQAIAKERPASPHPDSNLDLLLYPADYQRPAAFPGGPQMLSIFIIHNLKYPEEARKNNTEGSVEVMAVIESDGMVSEAKVLESIGYGCEEEALRVIKNMPRWQPAQQGNYTVRSKVIIPIQFSLR